MAKRKTKKRAKPAAGPPTVATPAVSPAERAERALISAALAKVERGEVATAQERSALKRFQHEQEEEKRWQFYRSIPKSHWREMSGRTPRVLIDQAERYGFPYPHGPKAAIELPAVVKWLHDFLAKNAMRLSAPETDDPLLAGSNSPALEEYRRERTKIARLERMQREGSLLPRDTVHELLGRIASVLRSAGENLARQHGPDAHQILDEALDDAQREIDSLCREEADGPK